MSFLPEDYSIPSAKDDYVSLEIGENRLRILDSPIMGNVYWTEQDKKRIPIRRPMSHEITTEELETGDGNPAKHFWALPVYSYAKRRILVWEITQKSILTSIKLLTSKEDWSNPREYDLIIDKNGSGKETEYKVTSGVPKPLAKDVSEIWGNVKASGFDIKELYKNGNPFKPSTRSEVHIDDIAS